ncbi:acrylyl-CoA reductase (NADPH) [Salinarimonas sp. NSM]|uniref:acrylyl-CoA reductase (NADPH) n=1 Tax=Salinarimonas sp. NSM TaxID=3458003 RepID=UPI004035365D
MRAIVVEKAETGTTAALTDFPESELMEGDVTLRVSHSTVNYKDGLALTGRMPVVRRFPMIGGIDAAGVVETSTHPDWKPGDAAILTGWGVGETHLGGYAEKVRVPGGWLVPLPAGMDAARAMALGTAGLTAALCVLALERHGLTPEAGPALVTGAAGGVGSVAVALLAKAGWRVIAATGRPEEAAYLEGLGAAEIVARAELTGPVKPLAKARWAAGVDTVGGAMLANALSMTQPDGAIAACGNAGGMDLPTSVAPFILRGVALLGVNSVPAPIPLRRAAWDRLARDVDPAILDAMTTTIPLEDVIATADEILAGRVRGRIVVEVG